MSAPAASAPDEARFTIQGEAIVFGFPTKPVELGVRRRPTSWRVGGAVQRLVGFFVIAPLTALVPPHAPWLIGSLSAGVILARKRLNERFTLERVEGTCPKCGHGLTVKQGRLKLPHPATCDSCHHQMTIRYDAAVLESEATPAPPGAPEAGPE